MWPAEAQALRLPAPPAPQSGQPVTASSYPHPHGAAAVALIRAALVPSVLEHGDGFNLNQQFRTAQLRLDARRCRHRVQLLPLIKRGPLFIESGIITVDVPQIAGRPDNVVPCRTLSFQQPCDVLECPAALRAKIANMYRLAVLVDAGRAREIGRAS